MDNLVSFVSGLSVDPTISNNTAAPHPRFSDIRVRKVCDQEKRRASLLEEQKRRRTETFNALRDLAEDKEEKSAQKRSWNTACETESAEDSKGDQETNEHGKKKCLKKITSKNASRRKSQLMLSEWLVDVPSDMSTEWYMVPCPEGQRSYVLSSCSKKTRALTKHGYVILDEFKSTLPNKTRLDCIWCAANSTFYVLDVLEWNGLTMVGCETEFRFAWLQGKFREMEESFIRSSDNRCAFVLLPFYPCSSAVMTDVMSCYPIFPKDVPRVDGLLFYHKRTHYYVGSTPLVGWLKPYMMQEVLGITVAEEFKTYTSIFKENSKKKNHKRKGRSADQSVSPDSMETVETKNEDCMAEMETVETKTGECTNEMETVETKSEDCMTEVETVETKNEDCITENSTGSKDPPTEQDCINNKVGIGDTS